METVTTCFKLSYTPEQYQDALQYISDMKKHPNRVFWIGKESHSETDLVYSVIAHRILSGFYNMNNAKYGHGQIKGMTNIHDN